jgi:glyoxylase-like metal-dependent hydrolase (beta-lactamase superfamily II)
VVVQELAPGLWRWTAAHPEWTPALAEDDGWEQEVGCIYLETPDAIVLIDPLVPTEAEAQETFLRNLDADVERKSKPVAILITIFFHARSTAELAARYGASVWAAAGAVDRIPAPVSNPFAFGDELPGGVVAIDAKRGSEAIYWLPQHGALVPGDSLLGDGRGRVRIPPASWFRSVTPTEFKRSLRVLLDLPVRRILVSHGEPVLEDGHAALQRALAE